MELWHDLIQAIVRAIVKLQGARSSIHPHPHCCTGRSIFFFHLKNDNAVPLKQFTSKGITEHNWKGRLQCDLLIWKESRSRGSVSQSKSEKKSNLLAFS